MERKPTGINVSKTVIIQEKIETKKPKIVFNKKQETKSERRSFALKPSLAAKIKQLAKENEVSENEVVCKILEQYFEES